MTSNPAQLFLLADHIKLSLLERQRAISLGLEPSSQDGHISRSLESLREGIEAAQAEQVRLDTSGDPSASTLKDQIQRLEAQFSDLSSQLFGDPSDATSTLTSPNDPTLAADFSHATSSRPTNNNLRSSSLRTNPTKASQQQANTSKSVRFTDNPSPPSPTEEANRAALFPYRDDPSSTDIPEHDPSNLSNQQVHAYHSEVLAQQDEQLDRLGESIGRQRHLSMQIGDELDGQVALLDEVDGHVDRHVTRLDQAKRRLGGVSRKAKANWGMTTIIILIVILVLLIVILK